MKYILYILCVYTCVTREHSFPFQTQRDITCTHYILVILYQHPTTLHKNTAGLLRPKPFVIPYCYRIGNMIHLVEKSSKPLGECQVIQPKVKSCAGKSK